MIAQPLAPSLFDRVSGAISVVMSAAFKRLCYQRIISALSQLSDVQLENAGIARRDIPAIAARTLYGA